MIGTYHNTAKEGREKVREYRKRTALQDNAVLEFFQKYPGYAFTPLEVMDHLRDHEAFKGSPESSFRRAITNLSAVRDDSGHPIVPKLVMTDQKRPGKYGRKNHTWTLYTGQMQLFN